MCCNAGKFQKQHLPCLGCMMTRQATSWYERPKLLPEAVYIWACQGKQGWFVKSSWGAADLHGESDGHIGHCNIAVSLFTFECRRLQHVCMVRAAVQMDKIPSHSFSATATCNCAALPPPSHLSTQ
jgi:hypothetical protein